MADKICKTNNTDTPFDTIYWGKSCNNIETVCSKYGLIGVNASNCFNSTSGENVFISKIVKRTLASEEFYK
jgi:hypothetical protein